MQVLWYQENDGKHLTESNINISNIHKYRNKINLNIFLLCDQTLSLNVIKKIKKYS